MNTRFKKIGAATGILIGTLVALKSTAFAFEHNFMVPIAGLNKLGINPGEYVQKVYSWGIGLGALLAVLMIVIGGAQYILAAGSFGENAAAKTRITSAVYGLLILIGASVILSIVNPKIAANLDVTSPDYSNIHITGAEMAALRGTINNVLTAKDSSGNLRAPLDNASTRTALRAALFELASASDADPVANRAAFDEASNQTIQAYDAYFDSPEYRKKITDGMTAAYGSAPTDEAVQAEIATRKDENFKDLTGGWFTSGVNKDYPLIKAQIAKNAKAACEARNSLHKTGTQEICQ